MTLKNTTFKNTYIGKLKKIPLVFKTSLGKLPLNPVWVQFRHMYADRNLEAKALGDQTKQGNRTDLRKD